MTAVVSILVMIVGVGGIRLCINWRSSDKCSQSTSQEHEGLEKLHDLCRTGNCYQLCRHDEQLHTYWSLEQAES